jgi:arylsulfatase A-like enzyme
MSERNDPQRSIVPVPDRPYPGGRPAGVPNVLIVLLDDVGFGASSTFGGPIDTPALERLAKCGWRYNRFRTATLCPPTRAVLLTELRHAVPNYWAPLAQILRLNGYATAQFGEYHEQPQQAQIPAGAFDRWGTGGGFDSFCGYPPLPEGGSYLTEDIADRCISWMTRQKALVPDKPFFVYFAPGSAHAPHHGRGETEWWDTADTRSVLEYVDHHIGRLVETLEKLEILDDTLICSIVGDTGTHVSARAGNACVVHWPRAIGTSGEMRPPFHSLGDVASTVLGAAGLSARAFNGAKASVQQKTPDFETSGSTGSCHAGSVASTRQADPEASRSAIGLASDAWEMPNTNADWTQVRNLALPRHVAGRSQAGTARPGDGWNPGIDRTQNQDPRIAVA